jgi:hypothetical protein
VRAKIDGTEITDICQEQRWRPKLSRTSTGVVRFPAPELVVDLETTAPELALYENDGTSLLFAGPVWHVQPSGDPASMYTEVTAYDHTIDFARRIAKTLAGDTINPGPVLTANQFGPAIFEAFIDNINTFDATVPDGGPMRVTPGTVASGVVDLSALPMSFPMTLDQIRALLVATGEMDVILVPGLGASTVDLTNGDGGADLTGSVSYEYDTGANNASVATITVDMDELMNALWYFLGPRGPRAGTKKLKAIPKDHWAGSITPTAPHIGGTWPAGLLARISASRILRGYSQEFQIFDDEGDEQTIRPLFEAKWAREAWMRANPQRLASVLPERGAFPPFRVGDLIHVAAGTRLNGGFSGDQRVYEFEVRTDANGVDEISDLLTSADQEGAPSPS